MDELYDYNSKYSGLNIVDISLKEVDNLLHKLEADDWENGKFGLGSVQWTGERTRTLMDFYLKESKGNDNITFEQVVRVEGFMVSYELGEGGIYNKYYKTWLSTNASELDSSNAAYKAGYLISEEYEISSGGKESSQKRGNRVEIIYEVFSK